MKKVTIYLLNEMPVKAAGLDFSSVTLAQTGSFAKKVHSTFSKRSALDEQRK